MPSPGLGRIIGRPGRVEQAQLLLRRWLEDASIGFHVVGGDRYDAVGSPLDDPAHEYRQSFRLDLKLHRRRGDYACSRPDWPKR